jgi:hypothetical protein
VKQALPAACTNAYEAAEVEMQFKTIGADPETGYEHANAVETYKQMLLPNGAELLTTKLHETLNIHKSLVWEQQADAFDVVNDIAMQESVAHKTDEDNDNVKGARTGELERLLTGEQEVSADELGEVLAGV